MLNAEDEAFGENAATDSESRVGAGRHDRDRPVERTCLRF